MTAAPSTPEANGLGESTATSPRRRRCNTTSTMTSQTDSRPIPLGCPRRGGRCCWSWPTGHPEARHWAGGKRLGDSVVRMLGYNGSVPGPTLKVAQGSEIVVQVTNHGDLDTTVHWHGCGWRTSTTGSP